MGETEIQDLTAPCTACRLSAVCSMDQIALCTEGVGRYCFAIFSSTPSETEACLSSPTTRTRYLYISLVPIFII